MTMTKNQTMKSLVTGGAGFIGSHLADELINRGHQVVVLDDLSGGFRENVNSQAVFVEGDIADRQLVDRLFATHNFDYVFHLAAYAAVGLSHFIKYFNYTNNLIGSVNLINAAIRHEVKCFVFTSSISVYGANQVPMLESTTPAPEDPYGIAKYAVELELAASRRMFDLNHIIFRPHNVYGERQNTGDRYRNVLGIFMNRILQGESMPVFGDGEQQRAFTYITDVVPVIADAVLNPRAYGEVFNVGADTPYTVNTLTQVIARAMGVDCRVDHQPPRQEVKIAYTDHTKARDMLGYQVKVGLEEGVRRMAEWVKKVGTRRSKKFEHLELTKNLPPLWRD